MWLHRQMPDFWSGTEQNYVTIPDWPWQTDVPVSFSLSKDPRWSQSSCVSLSMAAEPKAQGAALDFPEIGWQTQEAKGDLAVPDSSWSRLRCLQGKHKKKWKKADQWQNTGAKINNSVFWKRPTDEQHPLLGQKLWQMHWAGGWMVSLQRTGWSI